MSDRETNHVPRVLIVDDDEHFRTMLSRILTTRGYATDVAPDGTTALRQVTGQEFDVIVSDICMPGMDGIAFLRAVRETDSDIPVIFLTGSPSLETARAAIEYGAFRYLDKPVDCAELVTTVARGLASRRLAALQLEALTLTNREGLEPGGTAALQARFERAISRLYVAYQPIVRVSDGTVFGYEALMRSEEPSMASPTALLDAAERLDRLADLGRVVRARAVTPMLGATDESALFLNLHPVELFDDELPTPGAPTFTIARTVFFEVTERAAIDNILHVRDRVAHLRRLGYRIALDDLGAGYSGLATFAALEPEVVKLDMALTQGVDTSLLKRKLIRAMCAVCKDLGILVVAEGIETEAEMDAVTSLGCDFAQGFLLGSPGPGLAPARPTFSIRQHYPLGARIPS